MIWVAAVPHAAWGQWTGGPTGPIFYNGGSVGIGTSTPGYALEVHSATGYNVAVLSSSGSGNILRMLHTGAGTNLKNADFQYISGNFYFSRYNDDWSGGSSLLTILNSGNVGIGETNPQSKLAVNGNITAKDIMVTNTGWSDYVFQPGYRLRPLSEVRAYIQANHHLPDIPTEAEVKAQGASVGEMQAKLLAKIEELTLHMIQADERNTRLEKQNRELQDENREIRGRIAQ